MSIFQLSPRVLVEAVGEDFLLFDSEGNSVFRATGETAGIIRKIVQEGKAELGASGELATLLQAGVVEKLALDKGISRRGLIGAGGALIGASLITISLPSASIASSYSCRAITFDALRVDEHISGGAIVGADVSFEILEPNNGKFWLVAYVVTAPSPLVCLPEDEPEPVYGVRGALAGSAEIQFEYINEDEWYLATASFADSPLSDENLHDWVVYSDSGFNCVVAEKKIDFCD